LVVTKKKEWKLLTHGEIRF